MRATSARGRGASDRPMAASFGRCRSRGEVYTASTCDRLRSRRSCEASRASRRVMCKSCDCASRTPARTAARARRGGAVRRRAGRACCCAPASPGAPRSTSRATCSRASAACAGLLAARAGGDRARCAASGPRKRAELKAVVELVRRSLARGSRAARRAGVARRGARLPAAHAGGACRTKCSSALFLDSQNRLLAARGALPRHAGADERLPARGRQGGARAQRRGGDLRAQPPDRASPSRAAPTSS